MKIGRAWTDSATDTPKLMIGFGFGKLSHPRPDVVSNMRLRYAQPHRSLSLSKGSLNQKPDSGTKSS